MLSFPTKISNQASFWSAYSIDCRIHQDQKMVGSNRIRIDQSHGRSPDAQVNIYIWNFFLEIEEEEEEKERKIIAEISL